MPSQFYTKASIVAPYSAYSFDNAMFALFVAFQGLAMVFIWMVLFWVWFGGKALPESSISPLFDIKYKVDILTCHEGHQTGDFAKASDVEVVDLMKGAVARIKQPGKPDS